MKHQWLFGSLFAAVALASPLAFAAEDLTIYHPDLATKAEVAAIRARSAARFEALKKSIASSRAQFKREKLPPLVRERLTKRFQICDRLESLIATHSKAQHLESAFHTVRMLNDLEVFDRYFKDELANGKMLASLPAPKRFSVRDFGAKGDGVTDDTAAVEAAMVAIKKLNGAPAELVFPKGKYLFKKLMHAESTRNLFGEKTLPCAKVAKRHSNNHYYTKYIHFLLYDLDNLTVRGETPDTELLFAEPEIGILLAACRNVTLKDLTLRSTLKTHTQGDLVAVDAKNKTLTIRFDKGFPLPDDPCWKIVRNSTAQTYDKNGKLIQASTDIKRVSPWVNGYEKLGDRLYRVKYTAARYRDNVPAGGKIAFPVRQDRQSMLMPKRCKFVVFDNITILNAGASAMPSAECYATSIINCRIRPVAGSVMSSAADASINADCFFGPYYRNCDFRNFGDDGINVFGYGGHVLDHKGNVFKIDNNHFWGGEVIAPGETLTLKKKLDVMIVDTTTGKIKAVARVKSVKSIPENGLPIYEIVLDGHVADKAIVSAKMLAPDKTWRQYVDYVVKEATRLNNAMKGGTTFRKPDHIVFLSESGIGTVVTGCTFANNRHNGITLQSNNALIEKCDIGPNSDFGILLTSYYRGLGGWREGGLPYNVVITKNNIHDTFIALSLWYSIGIGKYAPVASLRDILFDDNVCRNIVRGVDVYNVNGFLMRRNVFDKVSIARTDRSRNVLFENILWNGETFAPAHFAKMSSDPTAYLFRVTNPKFKGKTPTINTAKLYHFSWSKEKDAIKVSEANGILSAEILKVPAGDKIHPAFIQTGFLFPGLAAGNYVVSSTVTATRDCEAIVVSELPKKKVFAQQKLVFKANVPQEVKLYVSIGKDTAWQTFRVIYFGLAKAPAGTKFAISRPAIAVTNVKAPAPRVAAKPVKLSPFDWSKELGGLKRTVQKNGMTVEVVKQPAGKIVPAFLQAGYVSRDLEAGNCLVTAKVTADRDCEILAISEIPGKKGFGQQKLALKARVPQVVKFKLVITELLAKQMTRVIYFGLAKAPAGTKFELSVPEVERLTE